MQPRLPLPALAVLAVLLAPGARAQGDVLAGCAVMPASSVWNTRIDTLPVQAASAAWIATIGTSLTVHPDFGASQQGVPLGIPIVTSVRATPSVPVDLAAQPDAGPYPIALGAAVEAGARHRVIALQADGCTLYELAGAVANAGAGRWSAASGAWFDLGADALHVDGQGSADEAGMPLLPLLARYGEVAAGEIRHALRFSAPLVAGAHVWPARAHASRLTGAQYPPLGTRFRLKASFDASGFSSQARVVATALKRYGMFLADSGPAWWISGEHHPSWSDAALADLQRIRGSDFEVVDASAMRVSADSSRAFAPPPPIRLRVVASGLDGPTAFAAPHDGSGRLFVTEQTGRVRIVRDGAILSTPFLDLSGRVSLNQERGLLGIAFDPAFATNRRFFIYYTMLPDDGTGGAVRISSFVVSATNPDLADPASEREVITIPHPVNANHNGGQLTFGPDGYLYAGIGDGGGAGDVPNNAQSLDVLLGKILRLDVSAPTGYAIPADNPAFAGVPGARREIWAYGLRNPWRFSFDRATGDLYIGDVGQNNTEEIDYVAAGTPPGLDFGWHVFEGTDCFTSPCTLAGATPPVLQYHHDATGGIAVIGGFVYRGTRNPALRGYYLYGDFLSNRVWAAAHEGASWTTFVALEPPDALASNTAFGEDESGELYILDYGAGRLFTIDTAAEPDGPIDVALAANGASASASSTFGPGFAVSGVIDGDTTGAGWTAGGGWADGTIDAYPDMVEIDFGGAKTIDRVVVYTVQDNYIAPSPPTDAMAFTQYGIQDFTVQAWDGAAWITLGSVTNNDRVKRTLAFAPRTTHRIRVVVTRALAALSRITEVEAWSSAPASGPANVALASTGATASASSTFGAGFEAGAIIDGERAGLRWTAGGGWADGTIDTYPDAAEVHFGGIRTIDRVTVYTVQDDYASPAEPTDAMAFTRYGIVDFTVEGWNGAAWTVLAAVSGNDRVKRTVTFAPFTTNRIRVQVTRALQGVARITEIEAWSVASPPVVTNFASAAAGAGAIASSTFGPGWSAAAVIDGERAGASWTRGGGWADGTIDRWPDWVEIAFDGTKLVDHVVVFTLQDDYLDPIEPTDTMTFSRYGITDFDVQGWDGARWVTLGTVNGNNLVKRTVAFAPFSTSRIRIEVRNALSSVSRITEIEAWGATGP